MTQTWTLTLKQKITSKQSVRFDASPLSLTGNSFAHQQITLHDGTHRVALTDLFEVTSQPASDTTPSLQLVGNLACFDFIGAHHQMGKLIIQGDVGDGLGNTMSGGLIRVTGKAGQRVGGAVGTQRRGMTGGRIEIEGSVGGQAGYRMRRGEVLIGGDAGDFLGAHMIAGTIAVGGETGTEPGYAMQRGSLLLNTPPPTASLHRFSKPLSVPTRWINLIADVEIGSVKELLTRLSDPSGSTRSIRGDAAVAGTGEIVFLV